MQGSGVSSKDATIDKAYYSLVRQLDYTWEDVMQEYVPQTLYTLEQLEEEAQEREKKKREIDKQRRKV